MPDPLEPSRVAPVGGDPPSTDNADATEAAAPVGDRPPPVRPLPAGGTTFGPYKLLTELGRGGMGVVYVAEELELKRRVALKVMIPTANDPKAAARFRREAEAQAKVEHDHVTAIYRVGEVNGTPFIAMPLLRGQTLSAALRLNPRPPLAEVVRIGREMAEGLAAAHAAGLIHRDIKPGNVWLEGPKRRVKILDFGLARTTTPAALADPATATGAIMGTPAYMAPEQARSQPVERRTDLWSLGVILYQMTTGRMPFDGGNVFDLLTAVVSQPPRPVLELAPDTPPALAGLVHRLLAKRPADRPTGATAVADELALIERALTAPTIPVVTLPLDAPAAESDPWSSLSGTDTHAAIAPDAPAAAGTAEEPRSRHLRRRNPRWPLLLIPVALVAAAALVFAAVRKTSAPGAKADAPADPAPLVKPPAKVEKPSPPANDQVEFAQWVLKQKGGRNTPAVHIRRAAAAKAEKAEVVTDPAALPTVPFVVVGATADTVLPEHAADIPRLFAALGNLEVLQLGGASWTDAHLAAALTALKGKTIDKLEIWDVAEPLPKTVAALQLPAAVAGLHLTSSTPDGISVVGVGAVKGVRTLRLGTGLTDAALATFQDWATWPDTLNLSGNAGLSDAGIAHIRPTGPRRGAKIAIDLTGTAVTALGVDALTDRLPEATVVWAKGTVPPKAVTRRTAALAALLDRGAQVTLANNVLLTQPDAIGAQTIAYLRLRSGPFRNPGPADAGSPAWDSAATGAMKEPLTDADLPALRDVNRAADRIYLAGQGFTDAGYAELLVLPHFAGAAVLEITNCDLSDAALPAVAARPSLMQLNLNDTKITDAGLKHLIARAPTLGSLRLAGTGLTDAAVPALAALPLLATLDLKDTKLTPDGVKDLAERLPYTLIRGPDGRVVEPTRKRPTRDEAVALLFKRGAVLWNAATPVAVPAKFPATVTQGSIRLATGPYNSTALHTAGWLKPETGAVAEPFDDADLFTAVEVLKLKELRSVYLHGQKVTDLGLTAFLNLPPARAVKELDLNNSALGDGAAVAAAGLPDLDRLQMCDTQVTDAGVAAVAAGRPGLLRLRLADTAVTDASVPHLSKLFALTDIDLKGTKVTEDVARRLAAALPYTAIRTPAGKLLRAAKPPLSRDSAAARLFDRGADVTVGAVAATSSVELLAKGAAAAAVRLATGPHPTPAAPAMKWDGPPINKTAEPFDDAELCQVFGALRASDFSRLHLVGQNVTDAGVATLAAVLSGQRLTLLEVSHCAVGDAGLKHLVAFPFNTLYMSGTQVTDAGVKHLAARAGTLDALRLADTGLTDAAVEHLKQLPLLTVLDVKGTQITEAGAKELAAALPKCHIRYGSGAEITPKK
jgi:serine/threonine protein kinase